MKQPFRVAWHTTTLYNLWYNSFASDRSLSTLHFFFLPTHCLHRCEKLQTPPSTRPCPVSVLLMIRTASRLDVVTGQRRATPPELLLQASFRGSHAERRKPLLQYCDLVPRAAVCNSETPQNPFVACLHIIESEPSLDSSWCQHVGHSPGPARTKIPPSPLPSSAVLRSPEIVCSNSPLCTLSESSHSPANEKNNTSVKISNIEIKTRRQLDVVQTYRQRCRIDRVKNPSKKKNESIQST